MSKSIDFCKQRIKESDLDFLPGTQFNEVNSLNILETMFNDNTKEIISLISKDGLELANNITVIYDSDADFDYFTNARCRNDGTLLFALENMQQVLLNVLTATTCCKTKMPKDYSSSKYHCTYTIGNIVTTTEYSKEFSTEEKPWMAQRDTAMLPIKFDVKLEKI